jgi:hypothetical protein
MFKTLYLGAKEFEKGKKPVAGCKQIVFFICDEVLLTSKYIKSGSLLVLGILLTDSYESEQRIILTACYSVATAFSYEVR